VCCLCLCSFFGLYVWLLSPPPSLLSHLLSLTLSPDTFCSMGLLTPISLPPIHSRAFTLWRPYSGTERDRERQRHRPQRWQRMKETWCLYIYIYSWCVPWPLSPSLPPGSKNRSDNYTSPKDNSPIVSFYSPTSNRGNLQYNNKNQK